MKIINKLKETSTPENQCILDDFVKKIYLPEEIFDCVNNFITKLEDKSLIYPDLDQVMKTLNEKPFPRVILFNI